MTTLDRPRTEPGTEKDSQVNTWLVGAVVLFILLAATFFILWMVETNESADLEATATAMETQLVETESALAASDADLASARSELAAVAEAVHPLQDEVAALFDAFATAIADPDAEEIASLFTPMSTHTAHRGTKTLATAREIGDAYVDEGPLALNVLGPVDVSGEGIVLSAVQPGELNGHVGFLIGMVLERDGAYLFKDLVWYAP